MEHAVIGIDIGGTNYRTACVDERGNIADLQKHSSKILFETGEPVKHMAELICAYIQSCSVEHISAISIGLPGEIARDQQTPLSMPNLHEGRLNFDGKNLVVPLQKATGLPVFIHKDANNLLECDIRLRNLYHKGIIAGIYFGTGVGCSVYMNGDFVYGTHGAAMLLGHIPFYKSTIKSHVGTYGCAETHASGYRLRRLWEEKFQSVSFEDIFTHCSQEPDIVDYIEAQACTAAVAATLFDPEMLILGGGVLEMKNYPFEFLKHRILELCKQPFPASDLNIAAPMMKNNTGVVGAAFYAYDQLKKMNSASGE